MGLRRIPLEKAERRAWECLGISRKPNGRSGMEVRCPFCGFRFWAYVWSLNGSGKRCENQDCRAKVTPWGYAYDDMENHKSEKII
jgi:hypothetical protein